MAKQAQTKLDFSPRGIALGLGGFAVGTIAITAAALFGDTYARRKAAEPKANEPKVPEPEASERESIEPEASTSTPDSLASVPLVPQAIPAEAPPKAPLAPQPPAAAPVGNAEHIPTDLMGDTHPGPADRAPDAFRPDPTAPVPDSERDGLRPATGPAPTLVAGHSNDRI